MRYGAWRARDAQGRWSSVRWRSADGTVAETSPAWQPWVGQPQLSLIMRLQAEGYTVYAYDDAGEKFKIPALFT